MNARRTSRTRRTGRAAASAHPRRPARRRGGRRSGSIALILTAVLVPLLALGTFGGLAVFAVAAFVGAFDRSATSAPSPPHVAGYRDEQLANACTIMVAGRDLGFDDRDRTLAVMTAMGESSLRNIDYGDWETRGVTNPDGSRTTSIGLFQQQDDWGTREQRLDPYTAATIFYRAMAERAPDRAGMAPTLVAHKTQVNADPNHYARYWDRAVRVVAALSGTPAAGDSLQGIPLCAAE